MAGVKEEAVNFAAGFLAKNPDTPMKDIQEAAQRKGLYVYPLIMGLARKKLGLGKPKRSGSRKPSSRGRGRPRKTAAKTAAAKTAAAKTAAPAGAAAPAIPRRGRGRPRKSEAARAAASSTRDPASVFNDFVTRMRALESENTALRATLAKIGDLVRK